MRRAGGSASTGWIRPLTPPASARAAGAALCAASIGLIWYTVGSNRVALALWHQEDDAPKEIVTWGAYRRIRHPFYTSFIMATLGAALLAPHWATRTVVVWAAVALSYTARREERRLVASALGDQYREYMRSTGRFIPWGREVNVSPPLGTGAA